jgi:hypothetical protein
MDGMKYRANDTVRPEWPSRYEKLLKIYRQKLSVRVRSAIEKIERKRELDDYPEIMAVVRKYTQKFQHPNDLDRLQYVNWLIRREQRRRGMRETCRVCGVNGAAFGWCDHHFSWWLFEKNRIEFGVSSPEDVKPT